MPYGFQDAMDIGEEKRYSYAMPESPYITIFLSAVGERYADLRIIQPPAEKVMEQSMQRYGQLTPVVVGKEGERYEMVDGFKRLRAGAAWAMNVCRRGSWPAGGAP